MRKATLDESVVTETSPPSGGPKIPSYIIRRLLTRMVAKEKFEK